MARITDAIDFYVCKHVCMHVCIHVCMYVYIYVCMCVRTCVYVCKDGSVYTWMDACMNGCDICCPISVAIGFNISIVTYGDVGNGGLYL